MLLRSAIVRLLRAPLLLGLPILTVTTLAGTFVRSLPTPAAPNSQGSSLTTGPDGTVYLTWSEPASAESDARSLRLAKLNAGTDQWTAPQTIVTTPLLMENWADFASLCVGTDGALTAQWFQKRDADARAYEGWYARSEDGGTTWRTPAPLGHEFVALAPLSQGRVLAVWLETTRARTAPAGASAGAPKHDASAPRPTRDPSAPYAPSMKLMARLLGTDGAHLGEWTVDPDVCTCCQNTVTVLPGDRIFVGYRGHTRMEIRDNHYVIFDGPTASWSSPQTLKDDQWKIPACPVNGPAADAFGSLLAVSWFTVAENQPRVQARLSRDAGRTLEPPLAIDLGRPLGRLETLALADSSAVFVWMEMGHTDTAAGIYARRWTADRQLSTGALIAESTQSRASGFPRGAVRAGHKIILSYTEATSTNQVRLVEIDPQSWPSTPATPSRADAQERRPPVRVDAEPSGRPASEMCVAVLSAPPSRKASQP